MVMLFTIIKLSSGVVPQQILDKHVISPKKVLAMDLNAEEAVQFFGLSVASLCALYPLANYGAEGGFGSEAEEFASFSVPSVGGFCFLLTAVWKMVAIRGEIRREAEETGQLRLGESSSDNTVVEASSFWFYTGVLATTCESAICIAVAVTTSESYEMLAVASGPIVGVMYLVSILCQPRRRSPKDMWKLRLYFVSYAFIGLGAFTAYFVRKGRIEKAFVSTFSLSGATVVFYFGLRLRAAVGRLPDEDLQTFLVNTLFKGGLQTLFSILFLTFRTTKCMFEKGSVAESYNTSWCSMMISVYLIFWWMTKLVQGSVRSEWRKDLNLSMEKIARMRDISLRRGVEGILTLVTGVCGIFLFSMMSADEMDWTTFSVVGLTGLVASFGVAISEIYSSLKAQSRRSGLSESGQIVERATELEEPVEECSWVFVGVSFLFTSTLSALNICYGVTLKFDYLRICDLILPSVGLSLVMAVFYKPKRMDASYKRFLLFHFFTFAFVSEFAVAAGDLQIASIDWVFALFRIPLWCLVFWLGLKLRASAANLPPQELSDFLCQTVLVKGTAATGTMLFFSLETVSCFISQDSLSNGQCINTSFAAVVLSAYVVILTTVTIASKSVPKSVQRETAWVLSSITSLKGLKWWQQIQGGLTTISALASLFLLSVLGVEGDQNSIVAIVGGVVLLGIGFAALIYMAVLVRTLNEQQQNETIELPAKQRSVRGISAGDVEEGLFAAALI